jgi:hypothetical protein
MRRVGSTDQHRAGRQYTFGAPSSLTRNRIGWSERTRPIITPTTYMPCSFGLLPHPRSGTGAQRNGLLRVTVTVRWIPLVTAAYGTRVARLARTTTILRGGDGSPLDQTVRRALGDHRLMGKGPKGLAAGEL